MITFTLIRQKLCKFHPEFPKWMADEKLVHYQWMLGDGSSIEALDICIEYAARQVNNCLQPYLSTVDPEDSDPVIEE